MFGNMIFTLLDEVKHSINRQNNDDTFNLLTISGVNRLEVKMCRILTEILNPNGCHNQKILFLKSFVENVLKTHIPESELLNARVISEYPTDENRRIDIVILTTDRFIPIEAKLFAKDQKSQCADYYDFANKNSQVPEKVFYLTLDGHLPYETEELTPIFENGDLTGYNEVAPLSFTHDICTWLDEQAQHLKDNVNLYVCINQFKNALESLVGNMNNKQKNKIADIISENSDKMKVAVSIAEGVKTAKENMLIKIFDRLDKEICNSTYPLEPLNNKFDYRYNNYSAIRNYYNKKTFPALVYKYKEIKKGIEIWFMIELADFGGLYCGFVVADHGENPHKIILSDEEIRKHLKKDVIFNKDKWWFYWNYIPEHIDDYMPENTPNFKDCEENYLALYDTDEFERYIKKCIFKITSTLHKLLP